ncbi:unnamed protein product [Brachionus calyciflorus]|uniref:Uncharacterized protein n=1 Tax=Brachionus calyciflorus TaxID=104777 RepID=A0A814FNR8_9BILA|nr:unnamed protein product [Brachionus calyciflorus]
MDETSIYLDSPNSSTFDLKGTKTVKATTNGAEKVRVSAIFTGSASGEKIQTFILLPRKTDLPNNTPPDDIDVIDESDEIGGFNPNDETFDISHPTDGHSGTIPNTSPTSLTSNSSQLSRSELISLVNNSSETKLIATSSPITSAQSSNDQRITTNNLLPLTPSLPTKSLSTGSQATPFLNITTSTQALTTSSPISTDQSTESIKSVQVAVKKKVGRPRLTDEQKAEKKRLRLSKNISV